MNSQSPDSQRDAMLRRALVPKGYRPINNADIEKMLDAIGDQPIEDAKLQRMLRKINGQEPMFAERVAPTSAIPDLLTPKEQEVFALCRSKNKPLPPDLAAKIKTFEDKAAKKPNSDGDDSSG